MTYGARSNCARATIQNSGILTSSKLARVRVVLVLVLPQLFSVWSFLFQPRVSRIDSVIRQHLTPRR